MENIRFPVQIKPAHDAAATPETRLEGEKEPIKNPATPPKKADSAPMYGPKMTPITGATMAAAVIACPGKPIIGDIFRKPKTTYNAVKHTVRASSFAVSSPRTAILQPVLNNVKI